MVFGTERQCLQHDWEQGRYVEGGILEGRIDWAALEAMETEARRVLRETIEAHDTVVAHYSGGLDINVISHMLSTMDGGETVTHLNFRTIEQYPDTVEYVQGMLDAYGLPYEEEVTDQRDVDWVSGDPDTRLFPTWAKKDDLYNESYRDAAHEYHVAHDVDAFITGRRNEHCITPNRVMTDKDAYDVSVRYPDIEEATCWQVNAIQPWSIEHVVAYLDKYNIPIMPGYRYDASGPEVPWHRMESSMNGESVPERAKWFDARELTVRHGYTWFWEDHILAHFPEGETKAADYAAETDQPLLSLEDGYDHGADANPVPFTCGPASAVEEER